jgi:alkaline phosphatase
MNSAVNRRQVFRLGAGALGAPALIPAQTKDARSVIFMVSDGMSAGVLPMAEAFSRLARKKGTQWGQLLARKDIVHGLLDMGSLSGMVTDSSAASSSWGTGSRVFNAAVNVLPDGTKLTPIGWLARDRGRNVGLVTTATVTHATPAGFASVTPRRDDEEAIASQYLDRVDVVLGGGRRFFAAEKRKDKQDLAGAFRSAGYQVSMKKADLKASPGQKLLGLYDDSHVPYSIDQQASKKAKDEVPTLAEMTRAALTSLDAAPNGFLLQIEGARIDHAAHANDAAGLLWDQLAFDDAIEAVLEYCARRPDTLVVVTSDHGNSNPGLSGLGTEYKDTDAAFATLLKARSSYSVLAKVLGSSTDYTGITIDTKPAAAPKTGFVQQVVADEIGIAISPDESKAIQLAVARGRMLSVNKQLDNLQGLLGQVFGNHTSVGWVGTSHTADYTTLTAWGPGSEALAGLHRNTDIFTAMARAFGIDFRNPSMNPATAAKLAAYAPRRVRTDWA